MNDPTAIALRDIHLPDPVAWWPPGPAWWVLLWLSTVLLISAWLLWQHHRKAAVRRAATTQIKRIAADFEIHCDRKQLAMALSETLRRASLSRFPRQEIAALTGHQWLAWLDKQLQSTEFEKGPGQALVTAPYQADPQYDADALIALCKRWCQKLPRETQSPGAKQ